MVVTSVIIYTVLVRRIVSLSVSLSPTPSPVSPRRVRARGACGCVAPTLVAEGGACVARRRARGPGPRPGPGPARRAGSVCVHKVQYSARRSDVRRKDGSQLRPRSPEHINV